MMSGFVGAIAISPIEDEPCLSKISCHVVPAFKVFQTPPEAAAAYISFPMLPSARARGPSSTARSVTRPLVTAGPMCLHAHSDSIAESYVAALNAVFGAGCAVEPRADCASMLETEARSIEEIDRLRANLPVCMFSREKIEQAGNLR